MSLTTEYTLLPAIRDIRRTFEEEIARLGGHIKDLQESERALHARATFSEPAEVQPLDTVLPGVALRVVGAAVSVQPYILRVVCTNGAVREHATAGTQLSLVEVPTWLAGSPGPIVEAEIALGAIARAIDTACSSDAFSEAVEEMRSSITTEFPVEHLASLLLEVTDPRVRERLVEMLVPSDDGGAARRTLFELMNGVTAAARDERNPEVRWSLECLGARIPALLGGRVGQQQLALSAS
jgi:hypothetical protein